MKISFWQVLVGIGVIAALIYGCWNLYQENLNLKEKNDDLEKKDKIWNRVSKFSADFLSRFVQRFAGEEIGALLP